MGWVCERNVLGREAPRAFWVLEGVVATLRAPLEAEEPSLLPERRRLVKVFPPVAPLSKELYRLAYGVVSLLKEVFGRYS
jgi:hypothetical protein